MLVLQKIIGFIVLLGGLVAVHELGHFLAAKLLRVKVLKFSIGFGPKLVGFKRGETEYVLAWLPLGGFVRMAGELPTDETTPEEEAHSFLKQPWWKRATIALAGPAFNIIFPILVFFVIFWGPSEVFIPRIGAVVPELPADKAGLQPGDLLKRIDGVPLEAFADISQVLQARWKEGQEVAVEYERDGALLSTRLQHPPAHGQRLMGVSLHARPAVLGVLSGSAGEAAGLQTFDRVVELNGEPIGDEVALLKALKAATSPLKLRIARAAAGAEEALHEVEVARQAGEGYAALGAHPGELFVAEVLSDSPADKAGLQRGDFLRTWNGEPLHSWGALEHRLKPWEGQPFELRWVDSAGEARQATLAQEAKEVETKFKHRMQVWELGLRPHLTAPAGKPETQVLVVGFWQAWAKAAKVVPDITLQMAAGIGRLLTGKESGESLGGPVFIFQVAADGIEQGLDGYLSVMALISISLALLNLLPVPILDGFTVLAALWEGLWRRPLPMRFREIAHLIGLVLVFLLMGYALKNDIVRLLR